MTDTKISITSFGQKYPLYINFIINGMGNVHIDNIIVIVCRFVVNF